jgi:hypothetical protein
MSEIDINREDLQIEILRLMSQSTISEHNKRMIKILLPVLELDVLESIFKALNLEKGKTEKLDGKLKRIEQKYRIMVEKLSSMEIDKFS